MNRLKLNRETLVVMNRETDGNHVLVAGGTGYGMCNVGATLRCWPGGTHYGTQVMCSLSDRFCSNFPRQCRGSNIP